MTFYSQIATMPMILKMIPPFLLFLSYTFFFPKNMFRRCFRLRDCTHRSAISHV